MKYDMFSQGDSDLQHCVGVQTPSFWLGKIYMLAGLLLWIVLSR